MKTMSILPIWRRIRRTAAKMLVDRSGIAATEFAVIVPVMLVMFFGTVEFSSGVAVDRKVTLMANPVRPDVAVDVRQRYRPRRLLCRQQGSHDALFVDADAVDGFGIVCHSRDIGGEGAMEQGQHAAGDR